MGLDLVVERFMDCPWEYVVFDRDAKGIAARIGRRLVLPARGGQLPPVGVPIRPSRVEDKGKFLVAHGPWAVPTRQWLATVASDQYVSINATPVGEWFSRRVTLPIHPSAVSRLPVESTVWGELVMVDGHVLFSPFFCPCGAPAAHPIGLDWLCDRCAEARKEKWASLEERVNWPDGDGGLTWYHSFEDED
jgi:hypothetical protein